MITKDKLDLPDLRDKIDEFATGDTISVQLLIVEDGKQRKQTFRGDVIKGTFDKRKPPMAGATFTVRRTSHGISIERILPFYSPNIAEVKLVSRGAVRRARIYYLRELTGKKAKIKRKI